MTNKFKRESREIPERRQLATDLENTGKTLQGYAVVFNKESQVIRQNGKSFREIILPNAFDASLQTGKSSIEDKPIYFDWRHDKLAQYGDTTTNLRLDKDEKGIKFTLQLPEYASNLREVVASGKVTGMSFEFYALKERWEDDVRYIEQGDLIAISLVPNGAYREAQAELRENLYEQKNYLLRKLNRRA